MNEEKKKRIKIAIIIFVVLVVSILTILITSKQVSNPITKDANQRAQFFVDLGNLLPKKKDTIRNGVPDDQKGQATSTNTTNTTTVLPSGVVPTVDTNGDGAVDKKDAVIDTNGDGVVNNNDSSYEVLEKNTNNNSQGTSDDSAPGAIPENSADALREIIKRDTVSTRDLVLTSSKDNGKTRDVLTLSWSSPTKMVFSSCTGSYTGGVYQKNQLKAKGITPPNGNWYNWDGVQPVPAKPQTKKVFIPYGQTEIIYVLTCVKDTSTTKISAATTTQATGVFGQSTETEDAKIPPVETVTAQVAIILNDDVVNATKNCSAYPPEVKNLLPECNSNADDNTELSLVASPAMVQPGNNPLLYWFSPANIAFASCEGVGSDSPSVSGVGNWLGAKNVPDAKAPVQSFDPSLNQNTKEYRYGISCTTKTGKVVRANAVVKIDTETSYDFCDGLTADQKEIFCPDTIDVDLGDYQTDTSTNSCPTGTAGQNTPLVLTDSEQAEYQKLLRQFFRLLPEIRTPEAITAMGQDIEELSNAKQYVTELTAMCWEETEDIQTDLSSIRTMDVNIYTNVLGSRVLIKTEKQTGTGWSFCGKDTVQPVAGITADICKTPKRRISPFFVDYRWGGEMLFSPDQYTVSGDRGDGVKFDQALIDKFTNKELIIPWTHLSGTYKESNDRGFYFDVPFWGSDGKIFTQQFANPRAKANTDAFYSAGVPGDEFGGTGTAKDLQDAIKWAFSYVPYEGYQYKIDGIGFNCTSDYKAWGEGYNFGGTIQGALDTKNKCGYTGWFEQVFGIGQ